MTYPYQISNQALLFSFLLLVAVCSGFGYLALTNEVGLIISGFIRLEADSATRLYAGSATTFVFVAGIAAVQLFANLRAGTREVRLSEFTVTVPSRSIAPKMIKLSYAEIRDHYLSALPNDDIMLTIKGESATSTLLASGFESEAVFTSFVDALEARV